MEEIRNTTLLRLHQDDHDALRTIYMMYASKVRDFAHRLLGNASDAEDITHDVFLSVWEARGSIDKVESLEGYLFRMTKNAVLNNLKHRSVKSKYNYELQGLPLPEQEQDTTANLLRRIDREVGRMPVQRQLCFHLSRYEKMSYREIADILGISPKTVQYHISKALNELRRLLAEDLRS